MSDSSDKPAPNRVEELQSWLAENRRKLEENAARERARRAALTPAQRAEEDHQRALATAKAARTKIFQRYHKMGATVLARESWTIGEFSWLVLAENPMQRGSWLDFEMDKAASDQPKVRAVLESCIGVTLTPINPSAKVKDQRFRIADLIEVAETKRLA